MGRVWGTSAVLVAVLSACTGGASPDRKAEEVRSIRRPDIEVFMTLAATKADIRGVRNAIRRSRAVRHFAYLSQEDALRVFRRRFADQPDLIATTTAEALPVSFPIRLVDGKTSKEVADQLANRPGVDEVKTKIDTSRLWEDIERLCESRREQSGPGDVEVFLDVDATAEETSAVRAVIEQAPTVRSFVFLSRDDALREFRRMFADRPKILRSTTADQLPTSFRMDLTLGEPTTRLLEQLAQTPGVDEVRERITLGQCNELEARSA
jgi:cell division protein FtsX